MNALLLAIGLAAAAFLAWIAWPESRTCQERNEDDWR